MLLCPFREGEGSCGNTWTFALSAQEKLPETLAPLTEKVDPSPLADVGWLSSAQLTRAASAVRTGGA